MLNVFSDEIAADGLISALNSSIVKPSLEPCRQFRDARCVGSVIPRCRGIDRDPRAVTVHCQARFALTGPIRAFKRAEKVRSSAKSARNDRTRFTKTATDRMMATLEKGAETPIRHASPNHIIQLFQSLMDYRLRRAKHS
jgi:hypothetical protein